MKQVKKQKVTLTELQRYLPFPCPNGNFSLPDRIRRFLLSPKFGNYSFKQQNLMIQKYNICYRNYFPVDVVVDHLEKITNGKYYRHSLERAVRNAAERYELIDWYRFYRAVKLNGRTHKLAISLPVGQQTNLINSSEKSLQRQKRASQLIKRVFRQFLQRKKIKKGRQQVQQIKRILQQRLISQLGKQSLKQVKQFYQKNNSRLKHPIQQFQHSLIKHKVNFIQLEKLVNEIFQMYLQPKKVIYLYLSFDPENRGWFSFERFKEVVFQLKKEKKFVAQAEYLSTIDMVVEQVRKDMQMIYYASSTMIAEFTDLYLAKSSPIQAKDYSKDYEIPFEPFYQFINTKGLGKYSRYQITKVLQRIKFYDNLHFLYDQPRQDQLMRALLNMTQKKNRRRQLHSQNEVFYSYKKILQYIVSRCRSQKLTRQAFNQFIISLDPTLKYNSFFCVFGVFGGVINVKRMKKQSQLNTFACLLRTVKSEEEYERLYEEFLYQYEETVELQYSSILDKIDLRLDFLLENHQVMPLPHIRRHDVVNYRKTITQIFQPDFDLIARSYIHRKIASKFIALYRRIHHNKKIATKNAMTILKKTLQQQTTKPLKRKITIQSNDSKSRIGSKRITTEKSIISCKTKKSQLSQKKFNFQQLQMMKQLLFELIDKMDEDKNQLVKKKLSNNSDSRWDYVKKFKVVPVKKEKVSLRSSLANCYTYHELIGLVVYGNNNQLLCYRNQQLEQIEIKLLYKPNLTVLGLQVFANFIVILTSYFTLQFYKMHQPSKYPFKTLKIGDNRTEKLSSNDIDKFIKSGQYGAYPKLLKSLSQQTLGVNMSFIDDSIWLLRESSKGEAEKEDEMIQIRLTKREHYFNQSIEDLINVMKRRMDKKTVEEKIKLVNQVVDFLALVKEEMLKEDVVAGDDGLSQKSLSLPGSRQVSRKPSNQQQASDKNNAQNSQQPSNHQTSQNPLSPNLAPLNIAKIIKTSTKTIKQKKSLLQISQTHYKRFLQIIQTREQTQQKLKCLTEYQFIEVLKFFIYETEKDFFKEQLREQLAEFVKQSLRKKVPEEIREVTLNVQDYLSEINFSLKDLIRKLDQLKQGSIKIKKIKDYFLKITQQTYLIHQKRIDSYLKKLAIAKNITYNSFVSIFTEWNYRVWEKPRLIVRDFLIVEKFDLLVYTLDDDLRIFVRTISKDSRIVAILQRHQAVPSIALAEDQLVLISGDSSRAKLSTVDLHLWRLHDDVILKLSSSRALKGNSSPINLVTPHYTRKSIHDDGITSITYLPRAHCLITASLDSTIKFHLITSNPFSFQQAQRIYYHDCYFLSLTTRTIEIQKGLIVESLISLRIKKHINEKNVNKYEVTCEVYDVEKIAAKVPVFNQFISLPMKLVSMMEQQAMAFLKKKEKNLARKVRAQMQNFISIQILQQSLQANFFSALKRYFIFNQPKGLSNILKYVQKKENVCLIMQNILLKYGLKIVDKNQFSLSTANQKIIKDNYESIQQENGNMSLVEKEIQKGNVKIEILEEDYRRLKEAMENIAHKETGMVSCDDIKAVAELFLFGGEMERFLLILEFEKKRAQAIINTSQAQHEKMKLVVSGFQKDPTNTPQQVSVPKQLAQQLLINCKDILKYFKPCQPNTKIQRFYLYLREMAMLLRRKKTPVWSLFSVFQENVSKQNFVLAKNFTVEMKNIGFQEYKIELIVWYLAENQKISIYQLLNYIEIAFKQSSYGGSFGQDGMGLSRMLKSNIIDDQQKRLQQVQKYNTSKLKQTLQKKSKTKQRLNSRTNKLTSMNSKSSLHQRKSQQSSNKSSRSRRQSKQRSNSIPARRSQHRSQHHSNNSGSRKPTISNSAGSFSKEVSYSHTKDSQKRQVYEIRHKMHILLANEKKTLWELVFSAIPQFLQEAVISESEFFDLFKLMKSPLKLSEKLSLLTYLKNQHPQRVLDLNDMFQFLEDTLRCTVPGEKYIIQYFVNKLLISDQNLTIEQALELYFFSESEEQQLTIQQFIDRCCYPPFKFNHFAIREFQQILYRQSKSGFIKDDIIDLIDKVSEKFQLKIQNKNMTILEEILFKMDKRKLPFEEIFPKVEMVTEGYFNTCIHKLSTKYDYKTVTKGFKMIKLCYKKSLRRRTDFISSANSRPSTRSTVSKILQIPYAKFKTQLLYLLQETRQSTDKQRQSGRKLLRYLQSKKMSVFHFFISLDLQKKFYLNQIQFQTGLTQIGIGHSFWFAIQKKLQNRLYYYEFVRYLVDNGILDIKCVDSEIQVAMQKLIKKVLRNVDLQQFYQKLLQPDTTHPLTVVTYQSFTQFFTTNYSFFTPKQTTYLFASFCNSQQIKSSKFSNDQIIKSQQNIEKTFNYKMFVEVIQLYKTETLTKTPQFKLVDYLKKRNVSLLHQFYKFLEKNKKNKEINQALKKKSMVLSREVILMFLSEIKGGLTEKQLKQLLATYPQSHIDFTLLNQKLQLVHKKASTFIQRQQCQSYLTDIYNKAKNQNVSIQRLFTDFSQNNKLTLKDFMSMSQFLNTGLNKIQLKKVFVTLLDEQGKGFCFLSEMMEAIDNVEDKIDKDEDDYQFDFLLEKIENNIKDVGLRESQITFPLERCVKAFEKVLTKAQTTQLYQKALQHLKKPKDLTQRDIHQFLQQKTIQKRMKSDKKYKQLVLNLLNTIKKSSIQSTQVYKYFTMGSKNVQVLQKQRFLLLYQSVILKSNIIDVNNLYIYFDENKSGHISLQKWEQKLAIVDLENQNVHGSIDQLKVFYKVKLFLGELYLNFIQKQFKPSQIYHYFDKHGSGEVKYNQFWGMIYQLGFEPSQQLQKKVVNYLDRTKSRAIDIRTLMNQLQNCLGKRQKTVLQTKTSFIFTKNQQIFQTKYSYFIHELIKRQQLIERTYQQDSQVHHQSCILQTQFLSIMKKFGIYLTQEQLSDLRRNFLAKENYLYLYPIYFMLKNIFEESSSYEQKEKSQRQLFKRLLQQMLRNKITLRQIQKIKSHQEMAAFMKQLKTFTPIEIEIVLQNISYEDTTVISLDKLKIKIRDSYVDAPVVVVAPISQQVVTQNTVVSKTTFVETIPLQQKETITAIPQVDDDYLNQTLRDHLRSLLKFQNHITLLQKYPRNIYQQDFKQLLQQLHCNITVKDMRKYFKAFSFHKKFIKTQNLIFESKVNHNKKKLTIQNQQEDNSGYQQLIQHIEKSLEYTNVRLRKALQKYFVRNYGFIPVQCFRKFLTEIGYEDGERERLAIGKFVQNYQKNYEQLQEGKRCTQMNVVKLADILSTEADEEQQQEQEEANNVVRTHPYHHQLIMSQQMKSLALQLKTSFLKLAQFMKLHDLPQSFPISQLYKFIIEQLSLKQTTPKQLHSYQQAARMLCHHFSQQQLTLQLLQQKLNHLIKFHYIHVHTDNQDETHDKSILESMFQNVFRSNIVMIFNEEVDRLVENVSKTEIGEENMDRLALNIIFEEIQNARHLLSIGSMLQHTYSREKTSKIDINTKFQQISITINTAADLVIQTQRQKEQDALTVINQKYYAISTQRRDQFETFAKIATHLNPSCHFIRAKGYFLWEPSMNSLPTCSIRYRWKFIRDFASKLLTQLAKIHKLGYCCPHLRFSDLNHQMSHIIDRTLYAWKIDPTGRVIQAVREQLFQIEQPYAVPQIMRDQREKLSAKCDTWIFGCLLYQFIWGHTPKPYFLQLENFIKTRNIPGDVLQLMSMAEYPCEFRYQFYDSEKILKVYEKEFFFNDSNSHKNIQLSVKKWQSYKGITYPLEVIFGKQLVHYQEEFTVLAQIHQVISECLNPEPLSRPTIQQLLKKKLFSSSQGFDLNPYIETLDRHVDTTEYEDKLVQAIQSIQSRLLNQEKVQAQQLNQHIQKINHFLTQTLNMQSKLPKVDKIFTIPKSYPWPEKQHHQLSKIQHPYSYNLSLYKEIIRQNPLFNTICKLYNKRIVDKCISVYLKMYQKMNSLQRVDYAQQQMMEKTQESIQVLILTVIEMSKNYNSPMCGFAVDVIGLVMYYIGENQHLNLRLRHCHVIDPTLTTPQPHDNPTLLQQNLSQYFKLPSVNAHKLNFIKKIQNVIYLNGQGNPQYVSISDYLIENEHSRLILQVFYAATDLLTVTGKCQLAISYFRDRVYLQEEMPELMRLVRVELLVMKNLHQHSLRAHCLSYFNELITNTTSLPLLFHSHLLYINFIVMLRNPLEPIETKNLCLDIILKLLQTQQPQILSTMNSSSCNIFPFLVRLLIEPKENSCAHEEFLLLKGKLTEIVEVVEGSIVVRQLFQAVEGGVYALRHFRGENYNGESFRLTN